MTDEQHFENGLAMLKTMVGEGEAELIRQGWREISPDLERLILEFVAGRIWTRSGLDLRTRSLSTVAALTALGRTRGLEFNFGWALGKGGRKKDVLEL